MDVPRLHHFVDGVNVKLEKAGGFRGAILALNEVLFSHFIFFPFITWYSFQ